MRRTVEALGKVYSDEAAGWRIAASVDSYRASGVGAAHTGGSTNAQRAAVSFAWATATGIYMAVDL